MWKSIFVIQPDDGQTVWIRVNYFYGAPVLATYDLSLQQFSTIDSGLLIPAYIIGRWKLSSYSVGLPIGSAVVGSTLIVG